jgi:PST family polysaccharide transporter
MPRITTLEVQAEISQALVVPGEDRLPTPSSAEHAIGIKAIRGSVWIIGATGAAKALGFLCQLALAWFLTKRDYGIYAIAISLSVMLSALRDGGLPMVLEQKAREFDRYVGPVFWMMLVINGGTAALIALLAEPAANLYELPELAGVITLFAASILLSVVPSVLAVRLAVDLRFRELGIIQVISATTRSVLLLYFAWAGFGARSFLLPLLVTNFSDSVMLWFVSRCSPWRLPPALRFWPELFRAGRWVVVGTFAIGFGNNGAYFVLGKFLPSELVGVYFFAYQLVVQLGTLLADNVYQVLVPSFARMRDDLVRMRAATNRALSVVVLLGAVASLAVAAIFAPLEQALWRGKWAGAAHAVYILAVAWPAAAGVSVLRALQMATGRFRQWGMLTMCGALASIGGTVVGVYVNPSPAGAALGFAGGALSGAAVTGGAALRNIQLPAKRAFAAIARPWFVLAVAAFGAKSSADLIHGAWAQMLATVVVFAILALAGLRFLARDSFAQLIASLRHILSRTSVAT